MEFLALEYNAFMAAQKRAGEYMQQFGEATALGLTDEELLSLNGGKGFPTMILHHGEETDKLHPIPNAQKAASIMPNARFGDFAVIQHKQSSMQLIRASLTSLLVNDYIAAEPRRYRQGAPAVH